MTRRSFRFGVVAGHATDAESWLSMARRIEDLGYDTMLMPDRTLIPSPFPALAAAAAVTSRLRFGTHVLAAPFRTAGQVARETDAIDLLSGSRFELGLGTGIADAKPDAEQLGMAWGTGAERLEQIAATIGEVKKVFAEKGAVLPPIMIAGGGPKIMGLAASEADILTLALPPTATEEDLAAKVGQLQGIAGERFDRLELATNLFGLGSDVPAYVSGPMGLDVEALLARGSYSLLGGTLQQAADTLCRRRDLLGISYVTVGQHMVESFAPIVEMLSDA